MPSSSPSAAPSSAPTSAPTTLYTMAPTEHFDPNDYNASTLETISFTTTYDQPWVAFDVNQMSAYQAISHTITSGLTDHVRSVYYSNREDVLTFMELLSINEDELRKQVEATCDDSFFDTVAGQVSEELAVISYFNPWVNGYANVYESTSSHLQGWLASAKSMLGLSPSTIVKAASNSHSTWLTLFADSLNIMGTFCPPPCGPAMKATSALLGMSNYIATSSKSENTNQEADNALDLQYSEVVDTVISFYDNLTAIVDVQTQEITGNWGKLQAWQGLIWPTNTTLTPTQIGSYMNATDSALQYQAYEWLYPAKYELCMQVTDCYSPLCTNSGGSSCCTNSHYDYCTVSSISSTKQTKSLGTVGGSEKDCSGGIYGCEGCHTYSKTCNVNAHMWMCEVGNDKAAPPSQVYDVLNSNNYTEYMNLIQDNNFDQTVLDGCIGSWNDQNCTSAGMVLSVHNIGDCVEENQPDDCGGEGHCDTYSYPGPDFMQPSTSPGNSGNTPAQEHSNGSPQNHKHEGNGRV